MNSQTKLIPLQRAIIGKDTKIRRALPSHEKKTIGAWCFLDAIGPVEFTKGNGLDVGPHPHTGLQTFTWMIQGELDHTDSLGHKQRLSPKQVNLMTAGHGISHTEVSPPEFEGTMQVVQFWIAQPDITRHGPADFEHYPNIAHTQKDGMSFYVLVGEFSGVTSPVQVATPLMGVDMLINKPTQTTLPLKKHFEYGILLLKGKIQINGEKLCSEDLMYISPGATSLKIETFEDDTHIILIGGEPFESPIIIWWNLVVRTQKEIEDAVKDWENQSPRFGSIPDYIGKRLTP